MITFVRTWTVAPGKAHEAMTFAHEVAKMVEAKVGIKVNVMRPIGGNPSRIGWVASYDNLAAFKSATMKLLSDAGYMKSVESSAPYFLPGSGHDKLWLLVPPAA